MSFLQNNIFAIVKKNIDQYDYYSLLANGAPADEHDMESKKIADRIKPEMEPDEMAEVIASVFSEAYGNNNSKEMYLELAQAIKGELEGKGLRRNRKREAD